MFTKKAIAPVEDKRSNAEKIHRLEKLGVKVNICPNKFEHKTGFILGKMKDEYPKFGIIEVY